jgi:hypothetical protein
MCGIDIVPPFQGLNVFLDRQPQGVALGYHVLALSARDTKDWNTFGVLSKIT